MERRTITHDQARALRLVRLGLAPGAPGAPSLTTPAEVARHHLALQGQDFPAVQWAIAARLPGTRVDDVLTAFDAGELVRTWPMRGTVHVLAAGDARWLLDLCGPVALRGVARRWQNLGIDQAFVDTVHEVTRTVLSGGRAASRDELVAAYVAAGLDFTEGQRRYHAIWYACQVGTALLGPTRDGENLLVLADEHVPGAVRHEPAEAISRLGRRYLTARGPASVEDLMHWTKLTKTQCRQAFSAIEDLVEVMVTGHERAGSAALHAPAADLAHVEELQFGETVPRVVVLAAFDEHLLGYRDRSLVLDPAKAHHLAPGGNGVFRPTVVLDGRVVGTWRRRLLTSTAPVEVTLFEPVRAADRKLIAAAFGPWGEFVGREPVVTVAG